MPLIPEQPYRIANMDCFDFMLRLRPASVDAIIVDPPYGTTQCKWDSVIPLEGMWEALKRVAKPSAAIVICCAQPFTSVLVGSNLKQFRYCWVWNKVNRITGFLDSKRKPLKVTEDIALFYASQPTYNPQMVEGEPYRAVSKGRKSNNYNSQKDGVTTISKGERYPQNLIAIKADERGTVGRIHPTQKPVALAEYLIKTYTNPGDTVLDFAMGSGTTGVACGNLGRRFLGCDNDTEHGYYAIAERRIKEAYAKAKGA